MPRDWRNDPKVIEQHCTCFYDYGTVGSPGAFIDRNGLVWIRPKANPDCPLHGDNPDHNVPEDW